MCVPSTCTSVSQAPPCLIWELSSFLLPFIFNEGSASCQAEAGCVVGWAENALSIASRHLPLERQYLKVYRFCATLMGGRGQDP